MSVSISASIGSITRGVSSVSLRGAESTSARVAVAPAAFGAKLSFKSAIAGTKLTAAVAPTARVATAFVIENAQNAVKRIRKAEKSRQFNKGFKSEAATRLKTAIAAFEEAKTEEDILAAEKLASSAFKSLDKLVSKGMLHKNTVARRKSRISRSKQRQAIALGLYTPAN